MSTSPGTPPESSKPSPDEKDKKMTAAEFLAQAAASAGNMGANSPLVIDWPAGPKTTEGS